MAGLKDGKQMKRREFIAVLSLASAVLGWPLAARAEQDKRVRHSGVLMGDFPQNIPEPRDG